MRLIIALITMISLSAFAAEDIESAEEATTPVVAAPEAATDNRLESEIPLNLDGKKTAASEGSSAFRILFTLGILGLVGGGAFVFLRKYKVPQAAKHQTQIKILQQHFLGPKKSLAIVRVAGESILIGITDQNISMIKSLSLLDDEVPNEAPQSFGKVLNGLGNGNDFDSEDTPAKASRKKSSELDTDEEFAISGIKDIVSKRLKGMRSIQ